MKHTDKVAIIIPTMNRTDFILRTVRYYASINSMHPIYIGDASEYSSEKEILEAANNKVEVHYYHWKGLGVRKTLGGLGKEAMKLCMYASFHGDDDYFIPDSLSKCADFLEDNDSYATAQGMAVSFSLDRTGPYGNIKSFGVYWKSKEILGETAKDRLIEITDDYWVPIFSVHRTSEFADDMLNGVNTVSDRNFGEYLNSLSIAIRGKSKFINCLYLVRNVHDRVEHPSHYRWVSSGVWFSSLTAFMNELTKILSEKDSITKEDARTFIDKTIENLLDVDRRKNNYRLCIRGILKKSGLLIVSRRIRKTIYMLLSFFPSDNLRLESLISRTSKYHNDFMPVLRSLNGSVRKLSD